MNKFLQNFRITFLLGREMNILSFSISPLSTLKVLSIWSIQEGLYIFLIICFKKLNPSKWVLQCGHIWKKEEVIVNMYCFHFFHAFHPCIVKFKCLGVNSKLPKLGILHTIQMLGFWHTIIFYKYIIIFFNFVWASNLTSNSWTLALGCFK